MVSTVKLYMLVPVSPKVKKKQIIETTTIWKQIAAYLWDWK